MPSTVTSKLVSTLTATENIPTTNPAGTSITVSSTLSSSTVLGASTTPAVSAQWSGLVTLVAGVATLDLTALARDGLVTVNATGLKLRALKIVADSLNTALVTLKPGATNGYAVFGLGVSVLALDEILIGPLNAPTAVDGTHKTLDLASAMGAAKVTLVMIFGA